jgi:hypothetical protein
MVIKTKNYSDLLQSFIIGLIICALFAGNLAFWYPGISGFDSEHQYMEAVSGHYSDWHPPIMAWVWSYLRLVKDGPAPMFFLQVFFYWLGLGIIALTLHNLGHKKSAWGVIAVGILPNFVLMNVAIFKDVGLAVTFAASFAIIFAFRVRDRKIPIAAVIVAGLLVFYGIMVRANGVFGGAPIIIYMIYPKIFGKPLRFIAACGLIVLLALPAFDIFNHKIIGAESSMPYRSLEMFDVTGIAHFSGDMRVFEQGGFTPAFIANCYTPWMWDTLAHRDHCAPIWDTHYQHQTDMWLKAIMHHPLAYAEHRLAHFNSALGFIEPRHHNDERVRKAYKFDQPLRVAPFTQTEKILDYVEFNPLTAPVFAFVLGLVLLSMVYASKPSPLDKAVLCLLLSGMFYMLGYLVVGVASDYRYQFWPMLAIFAAFVMCLPEHGQSITAPKRADWIRFAILGATLAATLAAQIAEGDALFPGS